MAVNAAPEKENMLTIGVVAKSFGVNENTIRRIEAAGLLKPAYVSEHSGYRYYDSDNISLLTEFFALRSFGFIYEDLKEYLQTPGDYSGLYEKLLAKQAAIDLLVEKFSRRLNAPNHLQCRTVQFAGAVCMCRKTQWLPGKMHIFDFAKAFLFDLIRAGCPIDYTRSLLILSDCTEYRTFQWDRPQRLTFCIPLREGCAAEDGTLTVPPGAAITCGWSYAADKRIDFREVIEKIDREFAENGLQQTGPLRAAFDICGYMRSETAPGDTVVQIMVPFR